MNDKCKKDKFDTGTKQSVIPRTFKHRAWQQWRSLVRAKLCHGPPMFLAELFFSAMHPRPIPLARTGLPFCCLSSCAGRSAFMVLGLLDMAMSLNLAIQIKNLKSKRGLEGIGGVGAQGRHRRQQNRTTSPQLQVQPHSSQQATLRPNQAPTLLQFLSTSFPFPKILVDRKSTRLNSSHPV